MLPSLVYGGELTALGTRIERPAAETEALTFRSPDPEWTRAAQPASRAPGTDLARESRLCDDVPSGALLDAPTRFGLAFGQEERRTLSGAPSRGRQRLGRAVGAPLSVALSGSSE